MKRIRNCGLINERAREIGALGYTRCVSTPAQNEREVDMTVYAERRQILRKLVFEPSVGAVMHL
jgi:hypothetical protein